MAACVCVSVFPRFLPWTVPHTRASQHDPKAASVQIFRSVLPPKQPFEVFGFAILHLPTLSDMLKARHHLGRAIKEASLVILSEASVGGSQKAVKSGGIQYLS